MIKRTAWMLPALLVVLVVVPRVTLGACNRVRCQAQCEEAGCSSAEVACPSSCQTACATEEDCERRLGYLWRLHSALHLAYGAGGAFHKDGVEPGFRQHLEVAGAVGPGRSPLRLGDDSLGGSRATQAVLLGASAVWGMTLYPSYLLGEVGYARGMLMSGFGAFVGMGARVFDSTAVPVLGVRAAYDILLVNVGLRALASFERAPDISLCLTVGVGRY